MRARNTIAASVALLCIIATTSLHAQYVQPSAARAIDDAALANLQSDRRRDAQDTGEARAVSPVRTVIGAFIGGVAGTMIGLNVASHTSQGCHGEYCHLPAYLLFPTLGESLGLAIGAHAGAGWSGHSRKIVLTTLSSVGILAGGALGAVALAPVGAGMLMLPLTAVAQVAAAWKIESH